MTKKEKTAELLKSTHEQNDLMKPTTICILTSGIGSRLGDYTKIKNKSLLSLNKESILTKIINNFPKNSKFIISIGYKSQQVKDFIKIHHPKLNVKFINIKNFSGKKSGPAFSLYKCKSFLQTPFFFVSCDTIWKKKISNYKSYNWMGSFNSKKIKKKNYCNLISINRNVKKIIDKKKIKNSLNTSIFVGLAFIKDYKIFWDGFDFSKLGEPQVSMGFKNLLKKNKIIKKIDIDWEDTGTKQNYEDLILKYEKYNFNKENQQIYISDSKVTKFFDNKNTIKKLYKKAIKKRKVFPENISIKNNFISYNYVKGRTLYNSFSKENFKNLLVYLEKNLWNNKILKNQKFLNNCRIFYYNKTHDRINLFLKKNNYLEKKEIIYKGKKLHKIRYILKIINWNQIFDGLPNFIHGDLQFDNILFKPKKNFKLIDWRPSFGNNNIIGDQYYDFAKLLGCFEINYDLVKKNKFKFKINKKKLSLQIPKRNNSKNLIEYFQSYLYKRNIDFKKVRIITGLIFLNMSPLHHHPFDKLLYLYGKYYLQKYLNLK